MSDKELNEALSELGRRNGVTAKMVQKALQGKGSSGDAFTQIDKVMDWSEAETGEECDRLSKFQNILKRAVFAAHAQKLSYSDKNIFILSLFMKALHRSSDNLTVADIFPSLDELGVKERALVSEFMGLNYKSFLSAFIHLNTPILMQKILEPKEL